MVTINLSWARLGRDRRGVTALEYGLIAAAVVAVGLSAFSLIGDSLNNTFTGVSTAISDADSTSGGGDTGS